MPTIADDRAQRERREEVTPARILVIDDSRTVLLTIKHRLDAEAMETRLSHEGSAGVAMAKIWRPQVILVDYHMPEMSGPEVVKAIRDFDVHVQIVLMTAHTDRYPALEMMRELDIQGFHDKQDGVEKLMVWIDAALKTYRDRAMIAHQAEAMRFILDASLGLHQLQPMHGMLPHALREMGDLLAFERNDSRAKPGLYVSIDSAGTKALHCATGKYERVENFAQLPARVQDVIEATFRSRQIIQSVSGVGVPVGLGPEAWGVFFFDPSHTKLEQPEHLQILAHQIALSFENVRLYEQVSTDALTGLFSRTHLNQALRRYLQLSIRHHHHVGLIFIDLDQFKQVNDTHGHHIGDLLLKQIGEGVRRVLRQSDVPGRVGGDEFVVVLPETTEDGMLQAARRLCQVISNIWIETPQGRYQASASLGCGILDSTVLNFIARYHLNDSVWETLMVTLISAVDAATYQAKHKGGGRVVSTTSAALIERIERKLGAPHAPSATDEEASTGVSVSP